MRDQHGAVGAGLIAELCHQRAGDDQGGKARKSNPPPAAELWRGTQQTKIGMQVRRRGHTPLPRALPSGPRLPSTPPMLLSWRARDLSAKAQDRLRTVRDNISAA